jgi:hypothetical protein
MEAYWQRHVLPCSFWLSGVLFFFVSCTELSLWWFGLKHNFWRRTNHNAPATISARVNSLETGVPSRHGIRLGVDDGIESFIIYVSRLSSVRDNLTSHSGARVYRWWVEFSKIHAFRVDWIRQVICDSDSGGRSNFKFKNGSNSLTQFQVRVDVLSQQYLSYRPIFYSSQPHLFEGYLWRAVGFRTLKIWG